MDKFNGTLRMDREPALAGPNREAIRFTAGGTFDPSYDRATAALRRWLEGMEAALSKRGK